LIGKPNAGKSTLLNRLVGGRLSIVTPKAQTTWQRVTGLHTEGDVQAIILDTPGILAPRDLLQRAMLGASLEAVAEADVVVLVVDAATPPGSEETAGLSEILEEVEVPLHLALNKADVAGSASVVAWERWAERTECTRVHRISAEEGAGVGELAAAAYADLPEGPFLYPEDELATEPVRFFVAELVRETIFEQYHQEIPYASFCRVSEFREGQDPVYIHVDVFTERRSQKQILVGRRGSAIKALGEAARAKIEHFLGRRVYLELWVKPLRSWRTSRSHLGRFGFRLPVDDESPR